MASKKEMEPRQLHEALTAEVFSSKRGFVEVGKLLSRIKRNELYKEAVGDGIDTWPAYLAQPEIGLTKSDADRMVQIYELFVEKFGVDENRLAEISIKNLHYLLPIVKELENVEYVQSLVDEAAHLSQRDFRERMFELKNSGSITRTYEFMIMRKCKETGSLNKVHDIESDVIKSTFNLGD